ncbi:MAG: PorT family protein [Muribaculaceae bacterium]|nr:PorT family protein [Muribaculaceae bacterium]
MKKFLLSLIALLGLLGSYSASAQFRYGPTVGIDLTTLRFSQDLFTVDKSLAYQAGVQAEMMFPGIGFGIDFAALYSQKGATLDLGQREIWAGENVGRTRSYLHYLEIPVNLRFKWTRMSGLEDYIAPYVFGGPTFGFLLAHNKVPAFEYAGADLGVQCGLGFEIKQRWQVQGSYTWGMTYAIKATKLLDFVGRNRSWQIRVAYMF